MAAGLAKRLVEGQSTFQRVQAGEGSRDLVNLVRTTPNAEMWLAVLEDADTRAIIGAMGEIAGNLPIGARHESYRDAARAMVEQKLTDRMIAKMDRLESASNRLAGAGILVAIIIAGVDLWTAR